MPESTTQILRQFYLTSKQCMKQAKTLAHYASEIVHSDSRLVDEALALVNSSYGRLCVLPGSEINIPIDALIRLQHTIKDFKNYQADEGDLERVFRNYEESVVDFQSELVRELGLKSIDDLE